MNTKVIILLGLASSSVLLHAQQSETYELDKYSTRANSYDDFRTDGRFDIENTMAYQVRHTTALIDGLTNGLSSDFSFLQRKDRGVVSISMALQNNQGEHLFYNGADRINGEALAGGRFTLKNKGTLFGMASYQQRRIEDIRFSYSTHPEDYLPYTVGDSLNRGDTNQEIYTIQGGYSKRFGNFHFGTDAMYEGIAERRTTNPKYANYSYWLRLGLNAAWTKGRHLFGVRAYPELNQQSATANAMVNSTKFFQFYGFGQWNRRETTGSLSYAREQRLWGGGGELLYVYGGKWHVSSQLVYNYRRLSTEERNFKNLFAGDKHYLRVQLAANRDLGKHSLYMQLSALGQSMESKENVYENQIQNEEQHLFDYVLVGANRFYHRKNMNADLRAKMIFNLPAENSIHVLAGLGLDHYKETYDMPFINIKSMNVVPEVALGYQKHHDSYALECNVSAAFQCNMDKTFNYVTYQENIFTRAQAYVPYLLRTEANTQLKANLLFSHRIGKGYELGFRSTFAYVNSDYRKDTFFTAGVNFLF